MKKCLDIQSVIMVYGDKELFDIHHLEVFDGERIGLVGANGTGKSTLMKLIAQEISPDAGRVQTTQSRAYMPQPTGAYIKEQEDSYIASVFDVKSNEGFSGGERTKRILTQVLAQQPALLLLDEPTTNMDLDSIMQLEMLLDSYEGAMIVISHDKEFLERVVNKLWIIDQKEIRVFNGSLSLWESQKKTELNHQLALYEQDQKERKRLEEEAMRIRMEAQKVGKKPKNMSSKEARLYSGTASIQQGHVQRRARQLLSRKAHHEAVSRPDIEKPIQISLGSRDILRQKNAVTLDRFSLEIGGKCLLDDVSFRFETNRCTIILGANGSGKTSLMHAMLERREGIMVNDAVRFGVFSQFHETIDWERSLLENVMKHSIYDQSKARIILSNLRFSKEDLDKRADKLSGGERAKCVLAMLIVSDINALILDEPTNHLDMDTQEAMLRMLQSWEHTMILITHNRSFIEALGDVVIRIEDKKLMVER